MIKRIFYSFMELLNKKTLMVTRYIGTITFLMGLVSFIAVIANMHGSVNLASLEVILTANIMTFGLTLYSLGAIGQYIETILKENKLKRRG